MRERARYIEIANINIERAAKIGFDARNLDKIKTRELTDLQRARFFRVDPSLLSFPIELTPGKPMKGKAT